MKRIVLISTTIGILIATFFSGIFIPKQSVVASANFLKQYLHVDFYQENILLKLQNEHLKAQLQQAHDIGSVENGRSANDAIIAAIYSTYPFNVKDSIVVGRGSRDGVSTGMVAFVGDSILLGQVASVDSETAVIKTIFDSRWQLPVRIGPDNVNGLFQGGNDPKITLIEKPIKAGDGVFSASKNFPLGIKIGEIKEVKEDAGGIFKEAVVKTPYVMGELQTIELKRF